MTEFLRGKAATLSLEKSMMLNYLYHVLVAVFNVWTHPFRDQYVVIVQSKLRGQKKPIKLVWIPIWFQYRPTAKLAQKLNKRPFHTLFQDL